MVLTKCLSNLIGILPLCFVTNNFTCSTCIFKVLNFTLAIANECFGQIYDSQISLRLLGKQQLLHNAFIAFPFNV